ncbi:LPP20 family lipoprotein [bacterium]|nr:LPP20 family lipoprotein [bacterium]
MKQNFQLFVFSIVMFAMTGCAGGSGSTDKNKAPEWISKAGLYDDIIIGVGIGEGLSEQKAKSQADLNGRKRIAETIQTQIKSLTTNFMEEAGTIDEKSKTAAAQEYFQEITQSITDVLVKGAAVEEYWPPYGEKTDNLIKFYAKVVFKKEALADEFKKKVQSDIAEKRIKAVKASAEDALKALDKAIGKWEQSPN